MKNLFEVLPEDFFKPFSSKYRQIYADCILLIFNIFKPEISYGVNRELVVSELTRYFEADDDEMSFDNEISITDPREKANDTILYLKNCGWLEYEQEQNHQINVVMLEYAIPVIDAMNKVIREEEAEYQGIISQIHASLQNQDLYVKPYELMIKGVKENTDRLVSELKKLSASIKRHMDKQTGDMDAAQIIELFFEYHQNIGSKAYLRMKTSENIAYFRSSIIEKLEEFMDQTELMDRAIDGYMEVEEIADKELATDEVYAILLDIKSMFYRLDDIIAEIDLKHSRYMKNAVMRARFKLATGNNMEGKLTKVLDGLAEEINQTDGELGEIAPARILEIFELYEQGYLSPESLKTIPVSRKTGEIDDMSGVTAMTREDRALYKEALRQRNRNQFTRKNINEYVKNLLGERQKLPVDQIEVKSRRDLIRIVYISLYAGNLANNYKVIRSNKRVQMGEYELPYFEIVKR